MVSWWEVSPVVSRLGDRLQLNGGVAEIPGFNLFQKDHHHHHHHHQNYDCNHHQSARKKRNNNSSNHHYLNVHINVHITILPLPQFPCYFNVQQAASLPNGAGLSFGRFSQTPLPWTPWSAAKWPAWLGLKRFLLKVRWVYPQHRELIEPGTYVLVLTFFVLRLRLFFLSCFIRWDCQITPSPRSVMILSSTSSLGMLPQ